MRSRASLGVIAAALCAAACTGDDDPNRAGRTDTPQVSWHECDASIEASFLSKHRCGTLTVLQDRRHPDGPTLDLAVLQVWPVGVEEEGLGTGFADNIGDPQTFGGGSAAGATRVGHAMVQLAFRGTAPSTPTLACPEVDALTSQAPALPDDDPQLRTRFLTSVRACAARLREAGVEPSNFDSAAAAADVEDLRRAMGVDSWWGAGSYGTQSRVLFRYLHDFPDRLGIAWLDSPWPPDLDDLTGGALGTRSALTELFAGCSADNRCNRRYPHLKSAWDQSLARTARTPLKGIGHNGDEARVPVLVDDAKLLRFVRFSVGGAGPENLTWLPKIISDAASGRLNPHLADLVASDPIFCAGYRPQCLDRVGFSWGVYLTSLCKEQLPGLEQEKLLTALGSDPAYEKVFARSPYRQACETWDTPGDQAPPPPHPNGTSLLLLPGQYDSYSRPEWSKYHAATWEQTWVFTAPNNTHNTLGYDECGLSVRNAWVTEPTAAPNPRLCATPPSLIFK
jgi:TAP-like protein